MKMNKILAAGIAATLAVTSLSAVVSAEAVTREFNMEYSIGTLTYKPVTKGIDAVDLGDAYAKFDAIGGYDHVNAVPELGGAANYAVYDAYMTLKVSKKNADGTYTEIVGDDLKAYANKIEVEINGQQLLSGATATSITAKLTSIISADGKLILPVYKTNGPAGSFVWDKFTGISSMKANCSKGEGDKYVTTTSQKTYNDWDNLIKNGTVLANEEIKIELVKGLTATNGADITGPVADLLDSYVQQGMNTIWKASEKKVDNKAAWLPVTTTVAGDTWRANVIKLSETKDHGSLGVDKEGNQGNDYNQTYVEKDYDEGTAPEGFIGLASQVADFFNKQSNGKIIFTFTAKEAAGSSNWLTGGVPSTEVGIKNYIAGANKNDFALFVNYGSTTGSLQAITELDAESGSVEFILDEILDDLGTFTKGTVQDLYYALTKGVSVNNGKSGMWVKTITLSYEEDSDVDADIEDDTAADDDDDTAADDDDDAVIADDDDDADDDVVADDDDDADDDIGGDIDPVTPADDDDDANPGTGVALAVVPAIVAAAAVVVSKKRK